MRTSYALTAPLALTMGEPASIAPEITALAWKNLHSQNKFCFFLIGDADYLSERLISANLSIPVRKIFHPREAADPFAKALPVLNQPLKVRPRAGTIISETASRVLSSIDMAFDFALTGLAAGMVTNPIQKEALYAAGFSYQGHTDYLGYLAAQAGHNNQEAMMLVAQDLRTVPITVHIPLADVFNVLTAERIITQARLVARDLKRFFGVKAPRLAFTGLNPHASENGRMGREEITIIIPALEQLRAEGYQVIGPLPADTAFHAEARQQYDAILCMYHDQALIPVKTIDFHGGVNVTLGLPIIRTSPDHGTALTLAGTGQARPDSLIAALRLAAEMAGHEHS